MVVYMMALLISMILICGDFGDGGESPLVMILYPQCAFLAPTIKGHPGHYLLQSDDEDGTKNSQAVD